MDDPWIYCEGRPCRLSQAARQLAGSGLAEPALFAYLMTAPALSPSEACRLEIAFETDFDPDRHPRGPDGKFLALGGAGGDRESLVGKLLRGLGLAGAGDPPELVQSGLPSGKEIQQATAYGVGGGTKENFRVEIDGKKYFVKRLDNPARGRDEMVASELGRMAGLSMPAVREVNVRGRPHIVCDWVEGKNLGQLQQDGGLHEAFAQLPRSEVDRTILTDYLIAYADAMSVNYMIDPDKNKLVSIDKELCLNNNPVGSSHYRYSQKHALVQLALGEDPPRSIGAPGQGLDRVAERQKYPLERSQVREVAQLAGKMAGWLRGRGMGRAADKLLARGRVLTELSKSDTPTLGDLEKLHDSHQAEFVRQEREDHVERADFAAPARVIAGFDQDYWGMVSRSPDGTDLQVEGPVSEGLWRLIQDVRPSPEKGESLADLAGAILQALLDADRGRFWTEEPGADWTPPARGKMGYRLLE